MQTQSYPKGGLLDSMCPPTAVPGALSSEQEFSMFPKAQLSTVGVGYCSVGQDFAGSALNLITSGSGKELPRVCASEQAVCALGCWSRGPMASRELPRCPGLPRPFSQTMPTASTLLACFGLWSGPGGCCTHNTQSCCWQSVPPLSGVFWETV